MHLVGPVLPIKPTIHHHIVVQHNPIAQVHAAIIRVEWKGPFLVQETHEVENPVCQRASEKMPIQRLRSTTRGKPTLTRENSMLFN